MGRINSLTLAFILSGWGLTLFAQVYVAPRTEWGQPDLQGGWNWSSNVPMQRPSQYGERQFLTQEEVEEFARRRAAADASSDAALSIEGVDGSYNDFWIESRNKNISEQHSLLDELINADNNFISSIAELKIANLKIENGNIKDGILDLEKLTDDEKYDPIIADLAVYFLLLLKIDLLGNEEY